MKRLLFALTSLAVLSCSEGRERQVASNDNAAGQPDLTLPDTFARADTSTTLASRSVASDSVDQVEKPRLTRPRRATPPRTGRGAAPRPATPARDTGVQGYVPQIDNTPQPDSAALANRSAGETTQVAISDTADALYSTRSDSAVRESVAVAPDTLGDPTPDTVSTLETTTPSASSPLPEPQDSLAAPRRDTVADAVDTTPKTEISGSTSVIQPDTLARRPADTTLTPEPATRVASSRAIDAAARTLPVGTEIHASLNDSITSRRDTVGQIVSARVMENVRGAHGRTLIRAGTPVHFTVTRIRPARSKSSEGRLALDVNGFEVEGDLLPVQAEVRPVPRELRGRGVGGSEVAKVGGGAAAGAILGRVVGGDSKGAVIGGVAGAAAGAVLADQTATRDVVVKAKTPVVFVLTAPLIVTP